MSETLSTRLRWPALIGVLFCALLSVYKGQDINWDLQNYHHYVAYAFLHDRLGVDLAAAGMQSYFNPTLDLPIYWLTVRLSGWQVGALIGAWHGLVWLFTLLIAREVWPQGYARSVLLVAATGVVAPVFWGGLGNAMGDNAAAVLALAAVWSAVKWVQGITRAGPFRWSWGLLTGVLLGACTALKLTNATVALALGLALLICMRQPVLSLKMAGCLLASGLLGFALAGGWWFYLVWMHFGNPFFPQFGSLFPSALADSVSIADKRFVPESVWGFVLRPVLMVLKPGITSEFFVLPLLWPIWYVALWVTGWRAWRQRASATLPWRPEQALVLLFVVLAFALWVGLFGIYRYTAALEPLLPLCIVLLVDRVGLLDTWMPWLQRLFCLSMLCTVLGGSVNWGHAGWADQSYRPDSGMQVQGDRPLVMMIGNGVSWLIPMLPARASYTSVGGNFNFGLRYDAEVRRRAEQADAVYAVVGMSQNWRFDVVDKSNAVLAALGLRGSRRTCDWLSDVIHRTKPHAGWQRCESAACAHQCTLTRLDTDQQDVERKDQASLSEATSLLRGYGLALDQARCTVEGAYIGDKRYPFRLCALKPGVPDAAPPVPAPVPVPCRPADCGR